jgi:hypothetical protein
MTSLSLMYIIKTNLNEYQRIVFQELLPHLTKKIMILSNNDIPTYLLVYIYEHKHNHDYNIITRYHKV